MKFQSRKVIYNPFGISYDSVEYPFIVCNDHGIGWVQREGRKNEISSGETERKERNPLG